MLRKTKYENNTCDRLAVGILSKPDVQSLDTLESIFNFIGHGGGVSCTTGRLGKG